MFLAKAFPTLTFGFAFVCAILVVTGIVNDMRTLNALAVAVCAVVGLVSIGLWFTIGHNERLSRENKKLSHDVTRYQRREQEREALVNQEGTAVTPGFRLKYRGLINSSVVIELLEHPYLQSNQLGRWYLDVPFTTYTVSTLHKELLEHVKDETLVGDLIAQLPYTAGLPVPIH